MIPEGREGAGWKAMAECFQEVVDFLSSAGKKQASTGNVGCREGVSFTKVVNSEPALVVHGQHASFPRDDVPIAGGKRWSRAKKGKSHAEKKAALSSPNKSSFNVFGANYDIVEDFCPMHFRMRLLGLRDELNRLIGSLLGGDSLGLKMDSPGCVECGAKALGGEGSNKVSADTPLPHSFFLNHSQTLYKDCFN